MSEPPQGAGSSHGLVPKRCTRVGEYLPTASHEERHLLYGDFCLSPLSLAVEAWLLPASSDRAAEESRVVVEVGPPDTTTGYVLRMLVSVQAQQHRTPSLLTLPPVLLTPGEPCKVRVCCH